MKEKFDVTGMTCSACSSRVEKCVSKLEGVKEVSVNLLTNSMQVEFDDAVIREQGIIDAVVHAGYGASIQGKKESSPQKQKGRESGANPGWKFSLIPPAALVRISFFAPKRPINLVGSTTSDIEYPS